MFNRVSLKIAFLVLLLGLPSIGSTNSYLSDQETISASMTAGTWTETALGIETCYSDETNLDLYLQNNNQEAVFRVYGCGVSLFDTADYLLTYDSDQGTQGATGLIIIDGKNEVSVTLPLGSCTTNGTFIPNTGVNNIKVEVTLKGLIERKLIKEIGL